MKSVFYESKQLDKSCCENIGLSEDIMMEHAAMGLRDAVLSVKCKKSNTVFNKNNVLILCGKGDNGADGYALARLISLDCNVYVFEVEKPQSHMCVVQKERMRKGSFAQMIDFNGVRNKALDIDIIVDCIYGSGFKGEIKEDSPAFKALTFLSDFTKPVVIACDLPSGMSLDGYSKPILKADITVAMGSLKQCQFVDYNKDFCGSIKVSDLGVPEVKYAFGTIPDTFLLEESDIRLPYRTEENSHKGSYGHVYVACGEKSGAAIIAAKAALNFGCGKVTVFNPLSDGTLDYISVSNPELMVSRSIGEDASAIVFGPGLGRNNDALVDYVFDFIRQHNNVKVVFDADIFYYSQLIDLLNDESINLKNIVLTPHPGELQKLVELVHGAALRIDDCIRERFSIVRDLCSNFNHITVMAKGANTVIGADFSSDCDDDDDEMTEVYINDTGDVSLAKAGSGDVLAGLTGALLAQNYTGRDACCTASLALSKVAKKCNSQWGVTPLKLIEEIAHL